MRGARFLISPGDPTVAVLAGAVPRRGARFGVPVVGISLYHTVGDRERALASIGAGFKALGDEVMQAAGYSADPYKAASGPIWDWWKIAGVPVINEWQKFQAEQTGSFAIRFAAAWEVYEGWQNRLATLRAIARDKLGHLTSPEPAPLPSTVGGAAIDAVGGVADTLGKVGKVALWGGLALGAAWGAAQIVNIAKGK